jgi:hypothetical protein
MRDIIREGKILRKNMLDSSLPLPSGVQSNKACGAKHSTRRILKGGYCNDAKIEWEVIDLVRMHST